MAAMISVLFWMHPVTLIMAEIAPHSRDKINDGRSEQVSPPSSHTIHKTKGKRKGVPNVVQHPHDSRHLNIDP